MIIIPEIDDLKFTDKELEDFFNKFNHNNLIQFDQILYYSSFSGNTKKLILKLEKARLNILRKKIFDKDTTLFEEEITKLNKKELILLYGLLEEVDLCISSDINLSGTEIDYFNNLNNKTYKELEKSKR